MLILTRKNKLLGCIYGTWMEYILIEHCNTMSVNKQFKWPLENGTVLQFSRMLCTKFGWHWHIGCGEEIWKCEKLTNSDDGQQAMYQ